MRSGDDTESREDSEGGISSILQQPPSNTVVLTPNRLEDGPTHVVFAHCRNKQGPEDGALKGLDEMLAKREKRKREKQRAKQRRQGLTVASVKRELPAELTCKRPGWCGG